jgi:anti-sigma B factor antagonist
MPAPHARVPAESHAFYGTHLAVDPERNLTTVTITGELDLDLTADLRDLLVAAVDSGPADVVFDLTGVTFIGSRSLGTLAVAARRAYDQGKRLQVSARHPAVIRAIELTGLSQFLRLTSSPEPGPAAQAPGLVG